METRRLKGIFPAGIAAFYTSAGQPDKLLEFYEWAVEQHELTLPEGVRRGARTFPQLEQNPRYQAVLRRMGLPP